MRGSDADRTAENSLCLSNGAQCRVRAGAQASGWPHAGGSERQAVHRDRTVWPRCVWSQGAPHRALGHRTVAVGLFNDDFGADFGESELAIEPGSVFVAEQNHETRPERSRLRDRGLDDWTSQATAAMFSVHDDTAEPDDGEPVAVHLD